MARIDTALTDTVQGGATLLAVVCAGGIAAALVAEALRCCGRAPRLVAGLDTAIPLPARRAAAVLLASMAAILVNTRPVAAEDSVHAWLHGERAPSTTPSPTTTTSMSTPMSTPTTPPSIGSPSAGPTAAPRPTPPPTRLDPAAVTPNLGSTNVATVHVVRRGDCLWSIAATRLGRTATNVAIDAAWRRIYAANLDAIGPDPDLIRPGLVLTLPPLDARP